MITDEIKNIKSGKSELRKFGIIVGIAFGLLGCFLIWREKQYYFYFFIISFALLASGLIFPKLLKYVHKLWMTFAVILGWFVTRLIIIILFYVLVTPIGLIIRLLGKDFLNLKFKNGRESYWVIREEKAFDKTYYEKQF